MDTLDKPASFFKHEDLHHQIKWLVLVRAIFAIVLIFSSLFFTASETRTQLSQQFLSLYSMSAAVLAGTMVYILWLKKNRYLNLLAYIQTSVDTFLVTSIVFVTGGLDSIFTFLYLVVIIYTSMMLFQKGSLFIATLASIQYALLIELQYFHVIPSFSGGEAIPLSADENQVIYRILITIAACFAVACLSGILSLQLKRARQDLKITQEHFKRVEKMAAMDEMISGVAHEIKNPLASLSGSIQMLREETRPGTYEDKLMQIALREAERLKQIADNIRLFAKPSKDRAERINISDAIEEVVTLFLNTQEWKSRIQVYTRVSKSQYVFIDPDHLKQILWNLIKNAAESIEDQGKITISTHSQRNRQIYLMIRDTGKGIDERQSRHIFDPFFTTKPEGTGLGLSILHRIIDTYEGKMDFESIPGKGSLFTVVFQDAGTINPVHREAKAGPMETKS